MKRVLVVDDSSFMRKSLTHMLESDETIEVVGTAADGEQAVRMVAQLSPDVVVLDLEMSRMSGLTALGHIMAEHPTPVLVLTGLNKADATIAIKYLEQGAVDVVPKPSGVISYDIDTLKAEIVAKVKLAAGFNVRNLDLREPKASLRSLARIKAADGARIVVIGASTGGPRAVATILPALPPSFAAAVLIVQHMSLEFVPYFAEGLQGVCQLNVAVAREGEALAPGHVVVSPGGCHTLVVRTGDARRVRFSDEPSPHSVFPCVDFAMASAAEAYGEGTVGILLTGIGSDGAKGMKSIKDAGGSTVAEDPATCLAAGMPTAAIDLGCIDHVVPLSLLAQTILEMI